jgi:predicted MFS family arabinose efflux permease
MLGPLMVAAVLYIKGSYQDSFAMLLIPALLALTVLVISRFLYPHPQHLEVAADNLKARGMNISFWLYLAGASLIAAGYADFPLIAYHFEKNSIITPVWIPVFYSIAVGVSAITAPLFGHYYDRKGFVILIFASMLSCFFAPLVFFGSAKLALLGVTLWSVGVGAHESLMRAIVANMVPANKRGSAYGVFNAGFGVFWFLGSFLMGILYDISIDYLVIFSVAIQLIALPILVIVMRQLKYA